ncbi:MAG: UDP-N-acetylglucosamine 2-epimerase (non-hydrolyzing) [Anaerolineales bacterium]|nr:UDP-N-acetylglucosamine 2-epimerase (non-hydrolyzing) [Anaerolineales bacterium]
MADSRLKVLSIFGTRPEAIKMAPVVNMLSVTPDVESLVCVTAQHRQMLDQVLDLFAITPDFDLDVMRPDQSLPDLTATVIQGLDTIVRDTQPDWILVQGDTTTVMAAGLLAYYHHVRVGHVEAGLRTGDKWQPFPEEVNRKVTGVVSDLHFAPTDQARDNLLREGVNSENIVITGNPVIDALYEIVERPYDFDHPVFHAIPEGRRLILVTAHRRENFGGPMDRIFEALREIAERYREDVHLVYPVHPNPNVREPAHRALSGIPNLTLAEPLDYLPMTHLMKNAYLVLTDSGGLQEEAPALGTPVLVLRRVTERPEAIQAGTARLVGSDSKKIVSETSKLLDDPEAHRAMAQAINPFGDGHAAERIVQSLLEFPS